MPEGFESERSFAPTVVQIPSTHTVSGEPVLERASDPNTESRRTRGDVRQYVLECASDHSAGQTSTEPELSTTTRWLQ